MKDMLKDIWFWATVILLALLLYKSCGKGNIGFFGCNKNDTLKHKIDTTINKKTDSSHISFRPTKEIDTVYYWLKPKPIHDTLPGKEIPIIIPLPVTDTLAELTRLWAIEKLYNKRNTYKDTVNGKNWTAIIKDTVRKNELTGVGLDMAIITTDTTIKEETTLLKHKLIVYFSLGAIGNRPEPFAGGSIGLGLKGKNDVKYSISAIRLRNPIYRKTLYEIRADFPIRLFKKNR